MNGTHALYLSESDARESRVVADQGPRVSQPGGDGMRMSGVTAAIRG
jgi:hypothetical protein